MHLIRSPPSSWTLLLLHLASRHRFASLPSHGTRTATHTLPARALSAPAHHAPQLLHPQPVQTQVPAPYPSRWLPHKFEAQQMSQHTDLRSVCFGPSTLGIRYSGYSLEARIRCSLYLSSCHFLMMRSWSSAEAVGAEVLSKEDMKDRSELSSDSVLPEEELKDLFSSERELEKSPLAEEAIALEQDDSVTTCSVGVATYMEAVSAQASQTNDYVTGFERLELPVNVGSTNKPTVHRVTGTDLRREQEDVLTRKLLRDRHATDEKRSFLDDVKVKDEISAVLEESLLEKGSARSSESDAIKESLNYISRRNSLGSMLVSLDDKICEYKKLLEATVKENADNHSSSLALLIHDVGELKALIRTVANDVGALQRDTEHILRLSKDLLECFSAVNRGPACPDAEFRSLSDFQKEENFEVTTESLGAGSRVAVAEENQAVVNPPKTEVKQVSENIGKAEVEGMSQADIGSFKERTDKTLGHEKAQSARQGKGNGASRFDVSIGTKPEVKQVSENIGKVEAEGISQADIGTLKERTDKTLRDEEAQSAREGKGNGASRSAVTIGTEERNVLQTSVKSYRGADATKSDAHEHLEKGLAQIFMQDEREPLAAEASGPPSNIPSPEWSAFLEHLKKLDFFKDEGPRGITLSTFTDPLCVRRAAFKFAHSHENIFEFLPPKDLQSLAQYGCPSNDRKVVAAGKRLRGHFQIEEKNVCDLCSLQSSCQAAYVKPVNVTPKLADLIQLLLCIELQAAPQRGPLPVEVKTSVQNLLKRMVSLSMSHESGSPISQATGTVREIQEDLKQTVLEDRMRIQDEQNETVAERKVFEANHYENRRNNADIKFRKSAVKVGAGAESKIFEWKCPRCSYMNYTSSKKCLECSFERTKNGRTDASTMKTSVKDSGAPIMEIDGSKINIKDQYFTNDDNLTNDATNHQSTDDQGVTERSGLKHHDNGQQSTRDHSTGMKGLKESVDVAQSIKDGNMDRGSLKNLDAKGEQDKSKWVSQRKAYSESDEDEAGEFEDSSENEEMDDEDDLPDYQQEVPKKKQNLSSLLTMGSDDIPLRRGARRRDGEVFKSAVDEAGEFEDSSDNEKMDEEDDLPDYQQEVPKKKEKLSSLLTKGIDDIPLKRGGRGRDGEVFKSTAGNVPRASWKQRGEGYETRSNYSRGTTQNRFGKDNSRGWRDEESDEEGRSFRSRRDNDEERGDRRFRSARRDNGSGSNDFRGRSGQYRGGSSRELDRNDNRSGSSRDAGNKSRDFSEGRFSGRGRREEKEFSPRSDSSRGRGQGKGWRR